MHVKAKHKEEIIEPETNPVETIEEAQEILDVENFKYEVCDFSANTKLNLENHIAEMHDDSEKIENVETKETNEIKLEVFILVEYDKDVYVARKLLIDNLSQVLKKKWEKLKRFTLTSLRNSLMQIIKLEQCRYFIVNKWKCSSLEWSKL